MDDRVQQQMPGTAQYSVQRTQPERTDDKSNRDKLRSSGPARLVHAAEEADAILSVAPRGTGLLVSGFDASRETVMSSLISDYQIIHFVTHSFRDREHPEVAGIMLTSVDRHGRGKDGLMPLHDIYSLHLSAELTVLSACETALGKDIKGEGLIGLTHSFMSAGSKSVVASLWKVDDRATAELMAHFYQSMLEQGMSPAAALRAAKVQLRQEKRWSSPYFWAGFVLQGEYKNHITVVRKSWLRLGLVLSSVLILIASGLLLVQRRRSRSPLAAVQQGSTVRPDKLTSLPRKDNAEWREIQ
jgi:CHAT domain-containing protein